MLPQTILEARELAAKTLLGNIHSVEYAFGAGTRTGTLLIAAATKFRDTWPRDVLRDPDVLLALSPEAFYGSLAATLDSQADDGRLPRRLSNVSPFRRNLDALHHRLFGRERKRGGLFEPEWHTATWNTFIGRKFVGPRSHPVDTYPIVLIALAEAAFHDRDFAARYEANADRALAYLEGLLQGGFLRHPPHGGWNDHLHLDAFLAEQQMDLQHMIARHADMKERLGHGEDAAVLRERADRLRDAINEAFWDEHRGHYVFAIDPLRQNMSVLANSRAILYGIAGRDRAMRILENFRLAHALHRYVPLHTPRLQSTDMKFLRRLVVRHYLTGEVCLPWNQAVAAEAAAGIDPDFATVLLEQIAGPLIQYNFPEILVYTNGKLVPLVKGSGQGFGFSWGAKAFIKAADALRSRLAPLGVGERRGGTPPLGSSGAG